MRDALCLDHPERWFFQRARGDSLPSVVDKPAVDTIVGAIGSFRRERLEEDFWNQLPVRIPRAFEEAQTAIDLLHDRKLNRRWSTLLNEIESFLGEARTNPNFREHANLNSTEFAIAQAVAGTRLRGLFATAFVVAGPQQTSRRLLVAETRVLSRLGDLIRRLRLATPAAA